MTELNQVQQSYLASVTNFTQNIKGTMEKVRDRKKLTDQDCNTIVNYYLEVINMLMVFNS